MSFFSYNMLCYDCFCLILMLLLDVTDDVKISSWFDLSPVGIQLYSELKAKNENVMTGQTKLDTLYSKHTVSSQSSIELPIVSYQNKDILL